MSIARLLRSFSVVSTWALCAILTGCLAIPIPFRPGSTVIQSPGSPEVPDFELRADEHWPWGESLAMSIAHSDPRILTVDQEEFLTAEFPDGSRTLSRLLLRRDPQSNQAAADCVLFLGSLRHATPKHMGIGPFNMGVDQTKRAESAAALLVDLRNRSSPVRFFIESHYAQTAVGVGIVGFATIGVPEGAVRLGMTTEVIRLLAKEQPTGPIRLVVLPYYADPCAADVSISTTGCPMRNVAASSAKTE